MSDSVRPQKRQPTRLPRPWDSPDKNTGVGCHFLLQCIKVKSESEVTQLCPTPSDPMDCSPPGSSVHGIFQARVLEWGAIKNYYTIWLDYGSSAAWWLSSKESTCQIEEASSIPGRARFLGGGHGNPFQCSCLENPHGQRSLVGYSPWGCKELDKTESTWPTCRHINIYLHTWKWKCRSVLSHSLWPHGLYSPWNSPGQNPGVGSLLNSIYMR